MDGRARYRDRSVLIAVLPPFPLLAPSPLPTTHIRFERYAFLRLWSSATSLAFPPRFIYIFSTPLPVCRDLLSPNFVASGLLLSPLEKL